MTTVNSSPVNTQSPSLLGNALQQSASYQKQIPIAGRVCFSVYEQNLKKTAISLRNFGILETTMNIRNRYFSTYAKAKVAFDQLPEASLFVKVGIPPDHAKTGVIVHAKNSGKKLDLKQIAKCTIETEGVINSGSLSSIMKSIIHVTHLEIQNVLADALKDLLSFRSLETLVIDNTSLAESLREHVVINPSAKACESINDLSLAVLESCPLIKKLVLTNVKGVSITALRNLQTKKSQQKHPPLQITISLPPDSPHTVEPQSTKADIYFKTIRYQSNEGDFSIRNTYTQTPDEGLQFLKVNNLVYSGIFLHIKTNSSSSETYPLPCQGGSTPLSVAPKIPDLSLCRRFTYQSEDLLHDERIVQAWIKALQTAKDLKEVTLYNVTHVALRHFQALSQITTLTVNNTDFEKAKERTCALHEGAKLDEKAHMPPNDDVVIDFQEKTRNLQHMWLQACPLVTKAAYDYINSEKGLRLHIDEVPSDAEKKNSSNQKEVLEVE